MRQIRITRRDIMEEPNINALLERHGVRLRKGLENWTLEYGDARLDQVVDPPFTIWHDLRDHAILIEQGGEHDTDLGGPCADS